MGDIRVIKISILAVFLAYPLIAQESVVASGFERFYNLEYNQAIADFTAATECNPDHASIWNHFGASDSLSSPRRNSCGLQVLRGTHLNSRIVNRISF